LQLAGDKLDAVCGAQFVEAAFLASSSRSAAGKPLIANIRRFTCW